MNRILGCELLAQGTSLPDVVFPGAPAIQITASPDAPAPRLQIYASSRAQLQTYFFQQHASYIHLWGLPAHPSTQAPDLAAWCADVIAQKCYERFRELLGSFVLVVDEPLHCRTTFVSDILGVRPLFLA